MDLLCIFEGGGERGREWCELVQREPQLERQQYKLVRASYPLMPMFVFDRIYLPSIKVKAPGVIPGAAATSNYLLKSPLSKVT